MRIKAILFDMGNTLVDYDFEFPEEVFQRILDSLNVPKSLDDIKLAFLRAKNEAENIDLLSAFGRMKCDEYWNLWDSLVLKHLGITEHARLGEIIQSKWFDFMDCTFYPEVREVLLELRREGLKTGLISNGYEEEIRFVIEKSGLQQSMFDIIVGVDTIEKAKPDPSIFRHAARKLNVKEEQTLFVGDNIDLDYKPAESAGINPLLIDRTGKQHNGVRTIKDLRELLAQIN